MTLLALSVPLLIVALCIAVFRREHRRHPRSLADLLPWGALVSDRVIVNKDGSLTAGWIYRGPDLDSATHEEMATLSDHLNNALLPLGDGWLLHVDAIRKPSADYPATGAFPDGLTALIDEERREQYQIAHRNYETTYAFYLTRETPDELRSRFLSLLVDSTKQRSVDWPAVLRGFEDTLTDIEDVLAARLELHRMTAAEILTHLHAGLTGLHHAVSPPPTPCYLDAILASQDFVGGFNPRIGTHHISVIAITGFPFSTAPGMLDGLNRLPIEYRWSTRFHPLDPETAVQHIQRFRRKWWQKRKGIGALIRESFTASTESKTDAFANKYAVEMAEDANDALALAHGATLRWGYYTPTLILMHRDCACLAEQTRQVLKEIRNRGFAARQEQFNAVEAFLGSLPGNGRQNIRRPLIHTLNLADLMPTTSLWPGSATSPNPLFPARSPALLWAATSGSTPFRFNLHVEDVGHTLVVGPTGSGKSAFVATLQAQWFRYPDAQVFTFDKGYSALPLTLAAGGHHYDIAAQATDQVTFYPLFSVDQTGERTWAADWLETLLLLQDLRMTPARRHAVESALSQLAVIPDRTLTILQVKLAAKDPELATALAPYVLEGSAGRLLDARHDALVSARYQVFEMSHLMSLGDKLVVPVLLYLFHQIERRLDGRPTLIVLEEAWTFLRHPLFAQRIQIWLKELRKKNAVVVFVTQSLGDLDASPLRHVLYESCPTKIFLANPEAANEQGAEFYRRIGLNARQIEIIARATPKRDYYYTSPNGRRLIDLTLGPVALAFVGAAAPEQLRSIRELAGTHAGAWPQHWLRQRNLSRWADRLEAFANERSTSCAI